MDINSRLDKSSEELCILQVPVPDLSHDVSDGGGRNVSVPGALSFLDGNIEEVDVAEL